MADFAMTGLCVAQLMLASALPVAGPCSIHDMPGPEYKNRFRVEMQAPFQLEPGIYAVRVTSRSAAPAHLEIEIKGQGSIILAPLRPLSDTVNNLTFNDGKEERWQQVTTQWNGLRSVVTFTEPMP